MWLAAMESRTSPSTRTSSSAGGIGVPGVRRGPCAAGAGAGAGRLAVGTGLGAGAASAAAAAAAGEVAEAAGTPVGSGDWATPWAADRARPALSTRASADLSLCRISELSGGIGVVYATRWR